MSQCDFEDDWEDFTPSLQDQLFENLEYVELEAAKAHDYNDNKHNQPPAIVTTKLLLEELASSQKENIPSYHSDLSQHSSSQKVKTTATTPIRNNNIERRMLSKGDSLDDDAIWGSDFDIDMLSSIQDLTEKVLTKEEEEIKEDHIEKRQQQQQEEEDPLFTQLSSQLSSQPNIGFITASGKGIPTPSKSALEKAKSLFEQIPLEEEETKEIEEVLPFSVITSNEQTEASPSSSEQAVFSLGFVTANGKEIKPPSKESLEKAKTLLHDHSLAAAIPSSTQQQDNMLNHNNSTTTTDDDDNKDTNDDKQDETIGTKRPADTPLIMNEYNNSNKYNQKGTKIIINTQENNKKRMIDTSSDSTVPSSLTDTLETTSSNTSSSSSSSHSAIKKKLIKPLQKDYSHVQSKPLKDILKSTGIARPRRGGLGPQVKPFKSPIIPSKISLTKAAIENKRTVHNNEPVFDLSFIPENRYSLKDLGLPGTYTRDQLHEFINDDIIDMTFKTAKLYPGMDKVKSELIKNGCNNLSEKWFLHHYGMVVWKLACLTRSYPEKLKGLFNPGEMTRQLLYRYEREINRGHRSVIKRILEHDDIAAKHMVLAISEIMTLPSPQSNGVKYGLRLTDGWYHILSTIDSRMSRSIEKKRLKVGYKLSISGARITEQNEPQNPLDQDDLVFKLNISSNSCLPVRYDTKLGYQQKKFIYRPIKTLFEDGGIVTMLDFIVCRKYPMMYMENLSNGQTVYRTAKEEEALTLNKSSLLPNFSADKSAVLKKKHTEMEERRVTGYFKIKVCDSKLSTEFAHILISNANEITYLDMKEGSRYRVSFLLPRHQQQQKSDVLNLKTIHMMTRWEPLSIPQTATAYIPRSLTLASKIKEEAMNGYEVDMVACVLHTNSAIQDTSFNRNRYHQMVFVTDQSLGLCQIQLRTQTAIKEDELSGQVIGLLNLKFERYDAKFDITCLKMTDESELIYKTQSATLFMSKGLRELKNWIVSHKEEVRSVRERLNRIVQ